ncbi:hypothetical protein [Actinomadura madurae]|nr:hypothetical protein [Actinomadura madurae]MCP9985051.1 hypothetical protein [Actinomadura madurae]
MLLARAQAAGPFDIQPAEVNGVPGLVVRDGDGGLSVMAFTVDAGLITAIDLIRNPDKLAKVPELG